MIRITNIQKTYPGGTNPVLRELSMDVPIGGLATILGGSGCGKSTLLRCVVGLEPFERGAIAFDGLEVVGTQDDPTSARANAVAKLRSRIAVVFQSFELFPHLTAIQNCTIAPIRVRKIDPNIATAKAQEHLSALGLAGKEHSFPDHLSGGQRQRVAIARALTMEPSVLLYDEPTSALDPSLRKEVAETLRRIAQRGVTQIAVTHDLSLARASDLIFIVAKGRVVESGPPSRVLDNPTHEETKILLAKDPLRAGRQTG